MSAPPKGEAGGGADGHDGVLIEAFAVGVCDFLQLGVRQGVLIVDNFEDVGLFGNGRAIITLPVAGAAPHGKSVGESWHDDFRDEGVPLGLGHFAAAGNGLAEEQAVGNVWRCGGASSEGEERGEQQGVGEAAHGGLILIKRA